jgi:hypothetical protein
MCDATEVSSTLRGTFCTGYTQKNGAVSIVKTIKTAPFFCVYPVYRAAILERKAIITRTKNSHFLPLVFPK